MGIDELTIFSMVLHSCSHAAPHRLARRRIHPVVARTDRCEIHIAAVLRMLGRKDMVEERTLIIVGISRVRFETEEGLCQLEHVVGVA